MNTIQDCPGTAMVLHMRPIKTSEEDFVAEKFQVPKNSCLFYDRNYKTNKRKHNTITVRWPIFFSQGHSNYFLAKMHKSTQMH